MDLEKEKRKTDKKKKITTWSSKYDFFDSLTFYLRIVEVNW